MQKDVAGVEPFIHVHHSDACFTIARGDRRLNRRRAAPAWQKRCVQIQTGDARDLQHIARQYLAVGHDNNHICLERADLLDRALIFDSGGLENGNCDFCDRPFYRCWFDSLLAADWLVGLRHHTDEFVF